MENTAEGGGTLFGLFTITHPVTCYTEVLQSNNSKIENTQKSSQIITRAGFHYAHELRQEYVSCRLAEKDVLRSEHTKECVWEWSLPSLDQMATHSNLTLT